MNVFALYCVNTLHIHHRDISIFSDKSKSFKNTKILINSIAAYFEFKLGNRTVQFCLRQPCDSLKNVFSSSNRRRELKYNQYPIQIFIQKINI